MRASRAPRARHSLRESMVRHGVFVFRGLISGWPAHGGSVVQGSGPKWCSGSGADAALGFPGLSLFNRHKKKLPNFLGGPNPKAKCKGQTTRNPQFFCCCCGGCACFPLLPPVPFPSKKKRFPGFVCCAVACSIWSHICTFYDSAPVFVFRCLTLAQPVPHSSFLPPKMVFCGLKFSQKKLKTGAVLAT